MIIRLTQPAESGWAWLEAWAELGKIITHSNQGWIPTTRGWYLKLGILRMGGQAQTLGSETRTSKPNKNRGTGVDWQGLNFTTLGVIGIWYIGRQAQMLWSPSQSGGEYRLTARWLTERAIQVSLRLSGLKLESGNQTKPRRLVLAKRDRISTHLTWNLASDALVFGIQPNN